MFQHLGIDMENCLVKKCHLGWVNLWENFCKIFLYWLPVVSVTFLCPLLNCFWDQPLVFLSFFVHRSTLQLFSLPRRKWMYNFQCSAAYQMDVIADLPKACLTLKSHLIFLPEMWTCTFSAGLTTQPWSGWARKGGRVGQLPLGFLFLFLFSCKYLVGFATWFKKNLLRPLRLFMFCDLF